jgi:hypothetical protein
MRALVLTFGIVAVLAATLTAADARHRHHRHYWGHYWGMHSAHVAMRPRGAFRGQPNTCWTDEGYGRRAVCNGRQ